jgi:hypothetical protein
LLAAAKGLLARLLAAFRPDDRGAGPRTLEKTAKKFKEYEKQHGPYAFGKFTKFLVPDKSNWTSEAGDGHGSWENHSGEIPEAIRNKITDVIAINLRSEHPLPLVLKVGENVDHSHDLHVKTSAHDGLMHIGLHMLARIRH